MARQTMRVAHVTQMTRALQRAAELTGGWTALAEALSEDGHRISKQACHSWNYRGVPAERALIHQAMDRSFPILPAEPGGPPVAIRRPRLTPGYAGQELRLKPLPADLSEGLPARPVAAASATGADAPPETAAARCR